MRGGPRTKRQYQGTCLIPNCERLIRAGNYCNKHFCQENRRTSKDSRRRRFLAQEVAAISGLSREEAARVINAILFTIKESLKRGEPVRIAGFGTFDRHYRNKQHWGRNIYFRPYKELKYMVKNPDWRP